MLSVFQILKNGICGKSQKKEKPLTQHSTIQQQLHLNKINPDDSLSEEEIKHDLKKSRRKESLDIIEQEMNKEMSRKMQKRNTLMRKYKIKVQGDNVPPLITNFTKMCKFINKELIEKTKYTTPTPIQMAAIPSILNKRNLIALAPTGSGKTAAFALPILQNLGQHKDGGPRCVIFSPSQELASQIYKEIKTISVEELNIKYIQQMNRDKLAFKQAWQHMDILITTPLKFLKLHYKMNLSCIEYLVMDEADKYFELGLLKQIQQLLQLFEQLNVVHLFFSATLPEPIEQLFKELSIDMIKIEIGGRNRVLKSVDQSLKYCSNEYGKIEEIKNLINEGQMTPPVLIFVQSKQRAEALLYELQSLRAQTQLRVNCIHGSMETDQREHVVEDFHNGKIWILICTDMMARGIDFKGVNLVINYDFPQSMITYVHRVGRTGRAGKGGRAITFFTDEDKPLLRSLGNILKVSGCDVPEWLFSLKKVSKKDQKHLERFPVKRERIEDQ